MSPSNSEALVHLELSLQGEYLLVGVLYGVARNTFYPTFAVKDPVVFWMQAEGSVRVSLGPLCLPRDSWYVSDAMTSGDV